MPGMSLSLAGVAVGSAAPDIRLDGWSRYRAARRRRRNPDLTHLRVVVVVSDFKIASALRIAALCSTWRTG